MNVPNVPKRSDSDSRKCSECSERPLGLGTSESGKERHAALLTDRIHALAAQGLKVRDISSLLHIHPLIALRGLNDLDAVSYQNGNPIRKLAVDSKGNHGVDAQVICDS